MRILSAFACALIPALVAGCGDHQNHSSSNAPVHWHMAGPPHRGTPVALGDDYQIGWAFDASAGQLQAYVLDGETENFVRIKPPSIDLTVKLRDRGEVLQFKAIANSATGEKVGSTSLFEAQADWLKTNNTFDAVLQPIKVEGTVYTNVAFNFPKGNEEQGK
jgi:hypothetical protein